MPQNPLECDDEYAPQFWLGKPCNLTNIKMPDADYQRSGSDQVAIHTLLDGFAVSRARHLRRVWELTYSWLHPDTNSILQAYSTRQYGIGPFVFIDPHIKNVLTPNQASGTDALLSTEGFSVTGTGEELSSSDDWSVAGTRSLLWQFTNPITATGGVLKLLTPTGLYGWATPLSKDWAFSGTLRAVGDPSITARSRIVWYGNTGSIVGSVTGSSLTVVSGSSLSFCVTGNAPATACYVEPQILVSGASVESFAYDTFTRSVSNAWGTADSGQAWTNTGGVVGNYNVSGTEATHAQTTVGAQRVSTLPVSYQDFNMTLGKIQLGGGITPLTQAITIQLIGRYVDGSNYYSAELLLSTANTVTVRLRKLIAGVFTLIATASTAILGVVASTALAMRFKIEGTNLKAKAWDRSLVEPDEWNVEATDTTFTLPGPVGIRSMLETGNTNTLPVTMTYDDLLVSELPYSGIYADQLQFEMDNECTDWEYGQGQPLVSIRTDGESVPRIRRTSYTYTLIEVTP